MVFASQKGFSLIELMIAMALIAFALIAYELMEYRVYDTERTLRNDQEVVQLANNRFNEFLATGTIDSGSTIGVLVSSSGSTVSFQSRDDSTIDMTVRMDK